MTLTTLVLLTISRTIISAIPALSFGLISSRTIRNPASSLNAKPSDFDKNRLNKIPVVICPGFGNDEIDYSNPLNQGEEVGFVSALTRRGFNPDLVKVLPLQRYEWVRVAGGLFDPNFYTGRCQPDGLGYGWYVNRLRETIEEAYELGGRDEKVLLIGHSAGGWLGRAALGDGSWILNGGEGNIFEEGARASDRVRALITVGAIHKPPSPASTCVTRGVLSYLEERYPGAYLASEGIAYISVGGDAIIGSKDESTEKKGSDEVNEVYKVRGERSASTVAYTAYKAVSGQGEMTGDGVVPLKWALLEGSRNIVLDGVLHSINEAGTTLPTDRWYGSEKIVDRWLYDALEEAGVSSKQPNSFLKWPEWKSDNSGDKVDLLRRFMIGAAPSILLAGSLGTKADAAETTAEAIRLMSSKTIPGLGPPDVYYPPYFVGKWRVTRIVTSSDDNDFQGLPLPLKIVSEMRFVPYDAGKDFEDFGNTNNSPAIADRAFNEQSFNKALSAILEQLRAAGLPTSKTPTTIQKVDWTPTNPNVLSISYSDGSSKEVKVTKRSSDVDGNGDGVFSSEFSRITAVPASPSSIAGGIPNVYKSRTLTKWKRAADQSSSNVNLIEGIEMAYVEQGTLGDLRNDPAGGTGAFSSLYGNDTKDLPSWRITKTKLMLERIQ
jgi:pimeloyl-ACP methyl ester carboxylesterase